MSILKQSTQDLHRRAELLMPADRLVQGTLPLSEYQTLLAAQYHIFYSLERHLQTALARYALLSEFFVPRAPLLADDLLAAGSSIPLLPGEDQENARHPPAGQATLAGMLYVMEGSALGGQLILKGLLQNAGLAHLPHHFYMGSGPLTGKRWKQFGTLCEAVIAPAKVPAAIQGATHTFLFFEKMLERHYCCATPS